MRSKLLILVSFSLLEAQEVWFLHPQKPTLIFLDSEKIISQKSNILIKNFYLIDFEKKYPNLAYFFVKDHEIPYLIFYQNQLIGIFTLKTNDTLMDVIFQVQESVRSYEKALQETNPKEALYYAYLAGKSQNIKQTLFWFSKAKNLDKETVKAFQKLFLQN